MCYAINVKFREFLDASILKRHLHNTLGKSERNTTSVTSTHILQIIVKSYTCNKCDSRSYLKTTTFEPPFWGKSCKKKSLCICFGIWGGIWQFIVEKNRTNTKLTAFLLHKSEVWKLFSNMMVRSWRSRPLISWFWCQGDGTEGRLSSTAPPHKRKICVFVCVSVGGGGVI